MKLPDYAAFVITYRRPDTLGKTIDDLMHQTHQPDLILVVDNDPACSGRAVTESFDNRIEYYAMNYNAGPAGAAHYGLRELSERNYQWIQWIDDDDPPRFADVNETLFQCIPESMRKKAGILTPSGNDFSLRKGRSRRFTNRELSDNEFVFPKVVGGNQGMMISAEVVKKGCLPMRDLFFGFEELDFCLQVCKAGFNIIAPTELFIRYRKESNRWKLTAADRRERSMNKPVWRVYYSVRNLIYILHYRNEAPWSAGYVAFRSMVKAIIYDVLSVKIKNTSMTIRAIFDAYNKRLGSSVLPE